MRTAWTRLGGVLKTGSLLAVTLGVGLIWGRSTVINSPGTLPPEERVNRVLIDPQPLLDRPLAGLHVRDMPLKDVFDTISRDSGVAFEIDWAKLEEDDNMDGKTPVTLDLGPTTVGYALRTVFATVTRDGVIALHWVAGSRALRIVGSESGPEYEQRLVQVGDLVDRLQTAPPERLLVALPPPPPSGMGVEPPDTITSESQASNFLMRYLAETPDVRIKPGCFGWYGAREIGNRTLVVTVSAAEQERVRVRLNALALYLEGKAATVPPAGE